MTVSEITQIWLNNRSPRTIRNYTFSIDRAERIVQQLYKKSFVDITYPELIGLMQFESSRQSPHSQSTMTYIFKSFFKAVQRLGVRKDNPAQDLTAPKYPDTLADRIIDHDAVERIIEAASNYRDRLMYKVLYVGGLRIFELTQLKCNDLLIQTKKNVKSFSLRLWGKGRRTDYVGIPAELGQELANYLQHCHPQAPMFSHAGGKAFSTQGVRQTMKLAAERAGYPQVTPHFFRHAHATQALANGANLVAVQRSLRHRSIQTTTKYIHLQPEDSANAFLPKLNISTN